MKVWQAGLLVLGAALVSAIAVKLAEAPPMERTAHVTPSLARANPASVESPRPESPQAAVRTSPAPADPPQAQQPDNSAPDVASAPPPVYSEPPHVMRPAYVPPAKTIPAPQHPEQKSGKAETPAASRTKTPPEPYQEPAPAHSIPDTHAPPDTHTAPDAGTKPVPSPQPAPPPDPVRPEPVRPDPVRKATLESGLNVAVRLLQPLSADRVRLGDIFQGVLADPLIAGGLVVGERGAPVTGRVVDVQRGGLTLRLLNFQSADGQRVEISTDPWPVKSAGASTVIRFRLAARITVTERPL